MKAQVKLSIYNLFSKQGKEEKKGGRQKKEQAVGARQGSKQYIYYCGQRYICCQK